MTAALRNNTISYHVLNENTLGYVVAALPRYFQVLAGKPQLGGHSWLVGPVAIGRLDALRSATAEDFEFFRVSATGHIAPARKVCSQP